MKMKKQSYTYNQDDVDKILKELKENPPKEVNVQSMGGYNNIVAKYMIARAGLLHRAFELAVSANNCLQNKEIVSSILLIRALFETSSVFGFIHYKIDNFIKTKNIKDFDTDITNILYGTRNGTTANKSINILTIIDKINKEIPEYRSLYDRLSEYAHPNFTGTSLLYGSPQHNMVKFETTESNNHIIDQSINDLYLSINALKTFIIMNTDIIEKFVDIVNELDEQ